MTIKSLSGLEEELRGCFFNSSKEFFVHSEETAQLSNRKHTSENTWTEDGCKVWSIKPRFKCSRHTTYSVIVARLLSEKNPLVCAQTCMRPLKVSTSIHATQRVREIEGNGVTELYLMWQGGSGASSALACWNRWAHCCKEPKHNTHKSPKMVQLSDISTGKHINKQKQETSFGQLFIQWTFY